MGAQNNLLLFDRFDDDCELFLKIKGREEDLQWSQIPFVELRN